MIEDIWSDSEFQEILAGREAYAKLTETEQEFIRRQSDLKTLQEHYPLFRTFMEDCFMEVKGFEVDDLQRDIANFMQMNIKLKMVQAQREQAKSMIVGCYAVWRLIHNPGLIVLIFSAGADVASQIALWVKLIIDTWDIMECLRPDKSHGDRTSAKAFDVNWMLKGADKSPSVACLGITSNMQGRRAGLLIPDDIESSKNGLTAVQQEQLVHLSRDFSNICSTGDILYLGTPQSTSSLYNGLEERGYTVRIWPGRYPTRQEDEYYGDKLAPWIVKRLLDNPDLRTGGGVSGTRGKPTSPARLGEEVLTAKELEMGPADFELQVMLNTTMSDSNMYPLKPRNLIVLDLNPDKAPGALTWLPDSQKRFVLGNKKWELYYPHAIDDNFYPYQGKMMYIDPAGGGKGDSRKGRDETVCLISNLLHGYVFIPEMLVLPGGYDAKVFEAIAELSVRHGIKTIEVEENMGKGGFAVMLRPVLMRIWREHKLQGFPEVKDVWENTGKEMRIINILEPIMARHRLVISPEVLRYDEDSIKQYPSRMQAAYCLLEQISKMTLRKGCLLHDDRVDALAGAVRYWLEKLNVDEQNKIKDRERIELLKYADSVMKGKGGSVNVFKKRGIRRRR